MTRDYGAFLDRVEALRTQVLRNGLGREVLMIDGMADEIRELCDDNMRCLKLAEDAVVLQRRVNEIVDARQEAFMDRVQEVLRGYLTSGTAGMQGLSRMLVDALDRVRD